MSDFFGTIFKFVIAILLMPVVYAASVTFGKHFGGFTGIQEEFFYWGNWFFVVVYLFLYQFKGMQAAGKKVISSIFGIISPAKDFFANILPFYYILLMIGFYLSRNMFDIKNCNHYFLFFGGFFIAMHIVLTASDLQSQEGGLVKPSYYFSISVVYLFCCLIVVLLTGLVVKSFVLTDYMDDIGKISQDIYLVFLKGIR